jgi:hypothetical protein
MDSVEVRSVVGSLDLVGCSVSWDCPSPFSASLNSPVASLNVRRVTKVC